MTDDKDQLKPDNDQQQQEPVRVKNPFKPGEEKVIDQEELDKEQEYKEALTERD